MRALSPQTGASMCVDTDTNTLVIMADTVHGSKVTATAIDNNSGFPLPPCVPTTTMIDRLYLECWLWLGSLALCALVLFAGTLHAAKFPLMQGDEVAPTQEEDMDYDERLLAVTSLMLVSALIVCVFWNT